MSLTTLIDRDGRTMPLHKEYRISCAFHCRRIVAAVRQDDPVEMFKGVKHR